MHSPRTWLLVCLASGIVFFGDALWGDRTLVPAGDLYAVDPWQSLHLARPEPAQCYDQVFQFYPWADFFRHSIRSGEFPLWNPYNYLGTPFFANPQTALLFPLTWLHIIFPLQYSFTLVFILKLSAVVTGMYAWLRSRNLAPAPATLGAVVFGLSMHTIGSLPYPYSNVTVVFPWAMLAVSKLLREVNTGRFLAVTAALTLIIVSGQPQSVLVAFLGIGIFILVESWNRFREQLGSLVAMGAALVLSVAISAAQWLPSLAYEAESMVGEGPRIVRSAYPYTLAPFLNLVIPNFFGPPEKFWGFPGFPDTAFYSSIVAVFLAFFAFSRQVPARPLVLLSVILVVSLGVVFGLPPFEFLLDLPGFDFVRRNKFVFLIVFVLAELAARGVSRLTTGPRRRLRTVITPCCVLFLLGGLGLWRFHDFLNLLDPDRKALWNAGRSALFLLTAAIVALPARKRKVIVLLVLLVLDVSLMSYRLQPRGRATNLYPPVGITRLLTGNPPRIYAFDGSFAPNSAQLYRLQDVRGYDVMTPKRLFRFMQAIDPHLGNAYDWFITIDPKSIHPNTLMRQEIGKALQKHGRELAAHFKSNAYASVGATQITRPELFDLLHIQYVFGPWNPPSDYTPIAAAPTPVFVRRVERQFGLFESWVVAPEESVIKVMSGVDLTRMAVVEKAPGVSTPSCKTSPPGKAQLVRRTTKSSSYEVEVFKDTVLVEFERFSPGWRAFLDGKEVEVFPTDYLFRGALIPAGKHDIEFVYQPAEFTWGIGLSLLGVGVCLSFACGPFRLKIRNQRELR